MERVEALKQKMKSGKLVKGFFLTMADPTVSEIAGYAGYDYVWIDAEHGPLDRQEILHHIVAAQGSGCAAFVRVPVTDRNMLHRLPLNILKLTADIYLALPAVNILKVRALKHSSMHGMR